MWSSSHILSWEWWDWLYHSSQVFAEPSSIFTSHICFEFGICIGVHICLSDCQCQLALYNRQEVCLPRHQVMSPGQVFVYSVQQSLVCMSTALIKVICMVDICSSQDRIWNVNNDIGIYLLFTEKRTSHASENELLLLYKLVPMPITSHPIISPSHHPLNYKHIRLVSCPTAYLSYHALVLSSRDGIPTVICIIPTSQTEHYTIPTSVSRSQIQFLQLQDTSTPKFPTNKLFFLWSWRVSKTTTRFTTYDWHSPTE